MAAALALVAALLFALAATLQQKGAMHLQKVSFAHPMSLIRLGGQTTWLTWLCSSPPSKRGGSPASASLSVVDTESDLCV